MRDAVVLSADMAVPTAKGAREALRVNGQFWTPGWVADAMAAYALGGGAKMLFDPGVGAGALLLAGRRIGGPGLALCGREIDPEAWRAASESGLGEADMAEVELRDFVLDPPRESYGAIVANPPYVRHHRLSPDAKLILNTFARDLIGRSIDGRAGLHVFFLLRCLERLKPGGRLAFIVSADICEGVFARTLWNWIGGKFRIDAVITFAPDATPFPGVDTNAVLLCLRRVEPASEITWAKVNTAGGPDLRRWVENGMPSLSDDAGGIESSRRATSEALATGLSRGYSSVPKGGRVLGDFARVMRGIATGDNDFFFMTAEQAERRGIPERFLVGAVGRMRDVQTEPFTREDWRALDVSGRPTRLLAIGAEPLDALPESLQTYLEQGVASGVSTSTLIATRRPWYRMEQREPPAFFFAYLGRREVRFIRNEAKVVPLTCLLCIYPHARDAESINRLWKVLSDPRTLKNLGLVGKSYGDGALKVEPRSLQRLPIPEEVLIEAGLGLTVSTNQTELVLT